jgi:hypothetical protein
LGLMAVQGMFDNRQAEAGAAGIARATAVDAIEAFGEAWNVFRIDADTGIRDGNSRLRIGRHRH